MAAGGVLFPACWMCPSSLSAGDRDYRIGCKKRSTVRRPSNIILTHLYILFSRVTLGPIYHDMGKASLIIIIFVLCTHIPLPYIIHSQFKRRQLTLRQLQPWILAVKFALDTTLLVLRILNIPAGTSLAYDLLYRFSITCVVGAEVGFHSYGYDNTN